MEHRSMFGLVGAKRRPGATGVDPIWHDPCEGAEHDDCRLLSPSPPDLDMIERTAVDISRPSIMVPPASRQALPVHRLPCVRHPSSVIRHPPSAVIEPSGQESASKSRKPLSPRARRDHFLSNRIVARVLCCSFLHVTLSPPSAARKARPEWTCVVRWCVGALVRRCVAKCLAPSWVHRPRRHVHQTLLVCAPGEAPQNGLFSDLPPPSCQAGIS